jgi:hypothetical protein
MAIYVWCAPAAQQPCWSGFTQVLGAVRSFLETAQHERYTAQNLGKAKLAVDRAIATNLPISALKFPY